MDLRWFEDVLVLLEEQNMTRAAERRNITQPAFSRRIRSFEEWMGVSLLQRKANRVILSPSLLAYEDEIRSMILRVQELRNKISTFKPERSVITIATQHALITSSFPDIAAITREHMPSLGFRLRAGNRGECVSVFLRGDASILLCYEDETAKPMPFDNSIQHDEWGTDRLVPLVGGKFRYNRASDGSVDDLTPAIVYPEQSYFGELLAGKQKPFSTPSQAANAIYQTAFSAGIKEMAINGLGIAWLPVSMVYRELENGQLVDLSANYGSLALRIALYTNLENEAATTAQASWHANRK